MRQPHPTRRSLVAAGAALALPGTVLAQAKAPLVGPLVPNPQAFRQAMEQFIGDLHKQANDVARESLALDALARELKIEVTEDDINAEFEKAGVKDVEASKAEFIADGRMPAVRESIRRSKTVDHLVENAKVTEVDETAKDAE